MLLIQIANMITVELYPSAPPIDVNKDEFF